MSIFDDIAALDRPQFFNGQRLFAADLQGLETLNRELRWLHNQSLHQPGIGNGYAVSGKKGATSVTIGPGYALDSTGREIVLTSSLTLSIPPVAGQPDGTPSYYDLTVSYPDDSLLTPAETRAGVCLPQGVVRLLDQPLFCWVALTASALDENNLVVADPTQAQAINQGNMVVVAQIAVLNCQLYQDVSVVQRRSARPSSSPYIAAGTEIPSWALDEPFPAATTPTTVPTEAQPATAPVTTFSSQGSVFPILLPIRLTATIDTSQAGFRTVPSYSARVSAASRLLMAAAVDSKNQVPFLVDGLITIDKPSASSFFVEVSLLIVAPPSGEHRLLPDFNDKKGFAALIKNWAIVWFGVEG